MTDTSSLLLLNDTLNDYVSSQGGKIQVDGTHDGSGTGGATLELQNTTIDGGGAITNPAVFNIDGLLKVDNATANTIENFDAAAGTFTNDGELLVADTSSLLLLNDTLNDYVGSQGGTIQVDGTPTAAAPAAPRSSCRTPPSTAARAITNPAVFNIDGMLKADNATANTIENFDAAGPALSPMTASCW